MSNKFCHHCGKPNTAGAKFCSDCGTGLNSLASRPPQEEALPVSLNRRSHGRYAGEDDDDEDDIRLDIRQTSLQVEIVKDRPLGESLSSVVAQGKPGDNEKFVRNGQYSGDEPMGKILADFKGEVYKTPKIEID